MKVTNLFKQVAKKAQGAVERVVCSTKPGTVGRQILYNFNYMQNLKSKEANKTDQKHTNKDRVSHRYNLVVARWAGSAGWMKQWKGIENYPGAPGWLSSLTR